MSRQKPEGFVYFSPVAGKGVVPRYGSSGMIGAIYVQGQGYNINDKEIVAIPATIYQANLKAYKRGIDSGALKVRSKEEYEAFLKASEDASQQASEEASPKTPGTNSPPKSGKRNKGDQQ